jgi:hypothetical protein
MDKRNDESQESPKAKIPFWIMLLSVMQASFGVQNKANKERDFASGSIKGFVVAALIFTAIFIMVLATIVRLVLP